MTEILNELKENIKEMETLIGQQKFNVVDAQKYLIRMFNIYNSLKDMEKSRDKWKAKHNKLKSETIKIANLEVKE